PQWPAGPLHLAAYRGDLERVRRLVAAGADMTARDERHGATALDWARWSKQDAVVAYLRSVMAEAERQWRWWGGPARPKQAGFWFRTIQIGPRTRAFRYGTVSEVRSGCRREVQMVNIGRRKFITLLGGATVWPTAARAQTKPAVVGWLNVRPRNRAAAT